MIDVHCHLLPSIDDGPPNIDEALALCRAMVANGIKRAVATPHIHLGRWDNNREIITGVYQELSLALVDQGIPLQLAMAAEVRIDSEVLPLLATQKIPLLGRHPVGDINYDVVLLELPHNHIPPGTEKLLAWLKSRNILAMIAHPERNKELQRNYDKLQPLLVEDCLLQLTAASVIGEFGEAAEALALWILDQNLASVIATDAHNLKGRRPLLSEAYARVSSLYGDTRAEQLTQLCPAKLTAHHFFSADIDVNLEGGQ